MLRFPHVFFATANNLSTSLNLICGTSNLSDGCIDKHNNPPFCIKSVAEDKKLRLVIDLRHINQCLVLPKFRYEFGDLHWLLEVIEKSHFFLTLDNRSGYHLFSIYPGLQNKLGFAWNLD